MTATTFEVVDLARGQVRSFEHRRAVMNFSKRPLAWAIGLPFDWLTGLVVERINTVNKKFAQQAVWFTGARVALMERGGNESIDPDFAMVDQLSFMEQQLQEMRETSLGLLKNYENAGGRTRRIMDAIRCTVSTAADLYEGVRGFRGAIQAHEANCCTQARGPSATAEEVSAALAGMTDNK